MLFRSLVGRSLKDNLVFRVHQNKHILLVVYVDVIVIIGDNIQRISTLKLYLQKKF